MQILKIVTLLLILVFNQSTIAQEESPKNERIEAYITFDMFSAFIFQSPRYTLGYVHPIHRRWLVGIDLGYSNSNLIPHYYQDILIIGNDYRIFEIRPKIYFKLKPSSKFQPYVSGELFYINHKDSYINNTEYLKGERYIRIQNGGDNSPSQYISYDEAEYFRQKSGINFNIGLFLTLIDNVGMNIDAGIGIRNRNLKYRNVVNPTLFSPPEDEGYVESPLTYRLGNDVGANISLNFKLFYKFMKN